VKRRMKNTAHPVDRMANWWSHGGWFTLAFSGGQSELTATNAPVGRSVHWMGCVFSFGAGWGS